MNEEPQKSKCEADCDNCHHPLYRHQDSQMNEGHCEMCNCVKFTYTPPQPQKQLSECKCMCHCDRSIRCFDVLCDHDIRQNKCNHCKTPESPKPSQPNKEAVKWHECECGRVFSQAMVDYQLIGKCSCGREFKFVEGLSQLTEEDREEDCICLSNFLFPCDRDCGCIHCKNSKKDLLKNWQSVLASLLNKNEALEVGSLIDKIIFLKDREAEEKVKAEYVLGLEAGMGDRKNMIDEAVKKERERCAKIADSMDLSNDVITDGKLGEFYNKAFRYACEKIKSEILNPEPPKE